MSFINNVNVTYPAPWTLEDGLHKSLFEGIKVKHSDGQYYDVTHEGLLVGNSSENIVTTDGTQTLTNKTLTTPIISTISNTGTITLPTASDTLVGRDTTDTLTNKRFRTDSCFFADTSVPTKTLAISLSGKTTGTSSILVFAGGAQIITFPQDTNATLASEASGSQTNTYTGIWAADQTANVHYARSGNVASMTVRSFSAAQNASSTIVSTTAIPAAYRPARNVNFFYQSHDNGTVELGNVLLSTAGILTFSQDLGGGSFSGTGTGGVNQDFTISWNLN